VNSVLCSERPGERCSPEPALDVARVFPLAEARKAPERIESGHVIGKIVLRIR
jgi:hypothetical protein